MAVNGDLLVRDELGVGVVGAALGGANSDYRDRRAVGGDYVVNTLVRTAGDNWETSALYASAEDAAERGWNPD